MNVYLEHIVRGRMTLSNEESAVLAAAKEIIDNILEQLPDHVIIMDNSTGEMFEKEELWSVERALDYLQLNGGFVCEDEDPSIPPKGFSIMEL